MNLQLKRYGKYYMSVKNNIKFPIFENLINVCKNNRNRRNMLISHVLTNKSPEFAYQTKNILISLVWQKISKSLKPTDFFIWGYPVIVARDTNYMKKFHLLAFCSDKKEDSSDIVGSSTKKNLF
ncbi:hypothetical protein H311_01596, partial [Anncaliia algerae PRA109]